MKTLLELFEEAFDRREKYVRTLSEAGTDCYRLFCGEGEGFAGLKADRMGEAVFLYQFEGRAQPPEDELKKLGGWCLSRLGAKSVYLKTFAAERSKADPAVNQNHIPLAGAELDAEIRIRENGLGFWIRPYDGFSTGIFLDQRDNRRALTLGGDGLRVLNLFAYTCGFSVYAAQAGSKVMSVDLSTRYLDWGKRNFEANGLSHSEHEFFASDTFQFLKGAKKRGRKFELVIVDPPSFSRDREGNVFSIAKDGARLAEAAAEVVAPGGRLFFSTNFEGWDAGEFRKQTKLATLGEGVPLPPAPKDFERQIPPLHCQLIRITS